MSQINLDLENMPGNKRVLFVADLPAAICKEDLNDFFTGYKVLSSKIIQNINKTYAFIYFESKKEAERARRELNGNTIQAKCAAGINKISKPVRLCRFESKNVLLNIDPKCNLLVKNLSPQVSANLLFNTFIKYGDVRSSRLVTDNMGLSKGFGFVSYYRPEDSNRAYEQLNDTELCGKNIKIKFLEKGRPKEKLFEESQTIYARIKKDENIKTEEEFKIRIMNYLRKIMGEEYKPKLITIRIEQRNAFITMNDEEEAKIFIKKFKELTNDKKDIYFEAYKSKMERMKEQMKLKNNNNLNNMNINSQYNQLYQPEAFANYNYYNNIGIDNSVILFKKRYEELIRNIDGIESFKTIEDAGDFIFELAEELYKNEAGKITGMILEFGLEKVKNLIINEPMILKQNIDDGHKIIQQIKVKCPF